MLSWILLIIIIALLSVIGFMLSERIFGRGEALEPLPLGPEVIELNRRAVEEGRLDDVTLEVVHRGYRMDQVDALVAQLAGDRVARPGVGRASEVRTRPGENEVDCYTTDTTRVEHD